MTSNNPNRRTTDATVRVDCYLRPASVSAAIESQVERLRALADGGAVEAVRLHPWPKEVVVSPVTESTETLSQYRTFKRWARQWGVSIEPPFRAETRRNRLTGETRETVVTPALCIAVSVDGRLREVFPHSVGDVTYTIEDGIEALRDSYAPVEPSNESTDTGRCPSCGGTLERGQGLYACSGCQWTGTAAADGRLRRYRLRRSDSDGEAPTSAEPII